jgi:hypothetical protein
MGGTNDILNFTGRIIDERIHFKFQRKLVTNDKLDAQFYRGNKTTIVFAYHPTALK